MATEYIELNLDDVVKRWSSRVFDASNDDAKGHTRNFTHSINYSRVKFVESEPEHQTSPNQGKPKSETIYETVFRNNTDSDQSFSLKTVRSTTSIVKLNMLRAIVADGKTKLNISQLPDQVSTTSGFQNELCIQNIGEQEFKEKLGWEIDTHVLVKSGSSVKADVLVKEKSYQAKFLVKTEIYGNIHVDVIDPDNNNALKRSHDGDIFSILKYYNKNTERVDDLTFQNRRAVFVSVGMCRFRYGVNSNVNLTTVSNTRR